MTHHRMNCTPAQYIEYSSIILWMLADDEYRQFAAGFDCDDDTRTITADRLGWNSFRAAAEVLGIRAVMDAATKERRKAAADAAKIIAADVQAMLWQAENAFEVEEPAAVSESPRQKSLFG